TASSCYGASRRAVWVAIWGMRSQATAGPGSGSGAVVLPILAGGALAAVVIAARRTRDRRAIPLAAFALANAVALFPRSGRQHIAEAAPCLVLLCAHAFHLWLRHASPTVVRASAAAIAL